VKITIDPEFEKILPPLGKEAYAVLRESIRRYGVRDAVSVWNGIVVDGHHRKKIADEMGIKYPVKRVKFKNREAAKDFILAMQKGRRNLTPAEYELAVARVYDDRIQDGRKNLIPGGPPRSGAQSAPPRKRLYHATATQVGEEFGVTQSVVRRNHQMLKAMEKLEPIVPDIEQLVLHKKYASRLAVVEAAKTAKTKDEAIAIMNTRGISERVRTEKRGGRYTAPAGDGNRSDAAFDKFVDGVGKNSDALFKEIISASAGQLVSLKNVDKSSANIALAREAHKKVREVERILARIARIVEAA
jgi:hypothetical protein